MPRGRGGGRSRGRGGGQSRGRGPHQSTPRSRSTQPTPTASEQVEHDEEATEALMIELGMKVLRVMTEDDMELFLGRLATECPMNDKMVYGHRCRRVNWEAVAFGAFGGDECHAAWLCLKTGTRDYRIMAEIVQEVQMTLLKCSKAEKATYQKKMLECAPGFPKKPAGIIDAFQMFCVEMWAMKPADSEKKNFLVFKDECHELFKSLNKEQKNKIKHKVDLARAEYERQVKEFCLRHPGLTTLTTTMKKGELRLITEENAKEVPVVKTKYTNVPVPPQRPQLMFIQTKLNKLKVPPTEKELPDLKAKFKNKWANMSDRKKSKWIEKCINKSQNYIIEMEEYKKRFPDYVAKDFKIHYQIRKIISKEEIKIWESFKGRPTPPPYRPYGIYLNKFCKSPEHASLPIEERKKLARAKWMNLGYSHKEMYKVKLRKMNLEYEKALEKYYEQIPSLIKPIIFENLPIKYKQRVLTSVDKVIDIPDEDTQNLIDASKIPDEYSERETQPEVEDNVLGEGESFAKKSKKRKRKHVRDEEVKEDIDLEEIEVLPEDLNIDSDNQHTKKKKKKRRKKSGHEEEKTEDNEGESGHVQDETLGMEQGGEGYDVPSYHIDDQELHEEDGIKIKKKEKKTRKGDGKPNVDKFTPGTSFKTEDVYDVIRGIFDARQCLGRGYSVLYYYAKHVSKGPIWLKKMRSIGILETAQQIYTTFLSLSTLQKQIFLDHSHNFHSRTVKELRYENEDMRGRAWDKGGFPGEPKPPPRSAKKLYWSEVRKTKRKNSREKFPAWEDLDGNKQKFYLKKLYRINNIYLKEYEEFVSEMSPSDLVAYTADCYKTWEYNYMRTDKNLLAPKGFTFPLPKSQLVGAEREPSPEIIEYEEYMKRLSRPEDPNPFEDDELINLVTERFDSADAEGMDECELVEDDSDVPSDEELYSTHNRFGHSNRRLIAKNEVKRASMVEYPI